MILIPIIAVILALTLDFLFGDPANRYHPTVWIGKLIGKFVPYTKSPNSMIEKINGTLFLVLVIAIVSILVTSFSSSLKYLENLDSNGFYKILLIGTNVILVGILLKTTVAIKGMENHASKIMDSLSNNDLDSARTKLSMIVKRDTKNLDKQHIISATLESISENIVDGITGPLFYFSIFGLVGAFVYRTVNTADSMIGYKTDIFRNIGWFAANCDKTLNFLPSRLTSLVMVFSCIMLREDWRHSIHIMKRDGSKTESPNAGYPMATLAGALGIKFEKMEHYVLGDGNSEITERHFRSAISIMKVTTILFVLLFTIPVILLLSSLGWWFNV
ncbi:putative cobalamin biosynthesis protein CobD [Nitrosotalea devaniterrae]|uniref:Probable cobalamin biosynthesis protein CobD n=1 Tax=Nitrosotalea devaniterrae TaxID=1078905 RepID=A0A128A5V3_9ARCH|nr:putative cobalamin biosynthesis protein CobD [Candidatus Nitrosotalea devanaterra]